MHRPHGHLYREACEECQEQQRLQTAQDVEAEQVQNRAVKFKAQQCRDVGRASLDIHRDHRNQHENRAKERIEEELERRVDPVRPAPNADDEEHRDQAGLKEQVEQHHVQCAENTQHKCFEQQERDHIFLDAVRHTPARGNNNRHQECGQHHKQYADPVNAHFVCQTHQPCVFFDKLEARVRRVKTGKNEDRKNECCSGGPQGYPLCVALCCFVVAPQKQRQNKRAKQRQKSDNGEKVIHGSLSSSQGHPRDQHNEADYHGERVSKDVAGLQAPCQTGEERHNTKRQTVDATVDDAHITTGPQKAAQ